MNTKELKEEINKPLPWHRRVYYFFYRMWSHVDMAPRQLKWFLQRTFRGYGDDDIWGLNYSLSKHIHKCLVAFKKAGKHGVSCHLMDEKEGETEEQLIERAEKKQNEILNDMIDGWEYLANQDDYEMELCEKKYKKKANDGYIKEINDNRKKAEKKAKLLIDHLCMLWD